MQSLFASAAKREQTLAFAHKELVAWLVTQALASAEDLGDPAKDTADELAERESRTVMQCVAALRQLVLACTADAPSPSPSLASLPRAEDSSSEAASDVPPSGAVGASPSIEPVQAQAEPGTLAPLRKELSNVWDCEDFWQRIFCGNDLDVAVRLAAYQLVSTLALKHPAALRARCELLAPTVYGSLERVEADTAGPMWAMVLRFGQACPGGFQVGGVKGTLPERVHALCRRAALGAEGGNAMLPLAVQMAQNGPEAWAEPSFAQRWLAALAAGICTAKSAATRSPLCLAFSELLVYFVRTHEARVEGSGAALASEALSSFVPRADGSFAEDVPIAVTEAVASSLLNGAHCSPSAVLCAKCRKQAA